MGAELLALLGPLRHLVQWSASGGEVHPGPSTAEYSLMRHT